MVQILLHLPGMTLPERRVLNNRLTNDRPMYNKRPSSLRNHGQTLVEFALILPVLLLLMLGVVQVILIGGAALAVNQAAVACARYASLEPDLGRSAIESYLKTIASPLINDSNLGNVVLNPSGVPRQTGSAVSVTISYNLAGKLFLGSSFFGINFPTQVSVTETMTSE